MISERDFIMLFFCNPGFFCFVLYLVKLFFPLVRGSTSTLRAHGRSLNFTKHLPSALSAYLQVHTQKENNVRVNKLSIRQIEHLTQVTWSCKREIAALIQAGDLNKTASKWQGIDFKRGVRCYLPSCSKTANVQQQEGDIFQQKTSFFSTSNLSFKCHYHATTNATTNA